MLTNLHQTIMGSKPIIHTKEEGVNKYVILILLLSSICVFAGRAYQHLFYDIPIRIVLWDQDSMEWALSHVFNVRWDDFIRSAEWDSRIQSAVKVVGVIYLCCCAWCIHFIFRKSIRYAGILLGGSALLFSLAVLYSLDKFGRVGEFVEYTCQWFTPIALFLAVRNSHTAAIACGLRMSIALTFAGHGLYAIGYYPIPGNFIDMMILGFGVNEDSAVTMLAIAGWLDLLVAIVILFPATDRVAAMYAFLWGTATALARIWTNFDVQFVGESISQWFYETLVRIPNALLPLVFLLIRKRFHKRVGAGILRRLIPLQKKRPDFL